MPAITIHQIIMLGAARQGSSGTREGWPSTTGTIRSGYKGEGMDQINKFSSMTEVI